VEKHPVTDVEIETCNRFDLVTIGISALVWVVSSKVIIALFKLKIKYLGQVWWHMPIIPDTWEAEMRVL
jgi:hypothetical protein